MGPGVKWGKAFGARKKFQENRRQAWQDHVTNSPNPPAMAPASRLLLLYQVYDLYKQARRGVRGYKYFKEEERQLDYISTTFSDINTALSRNLIPPKFQNINDISAIANILFQGNTNGASKELNDIALGIAEEISGTAEKAFIWNLQDGTSPLIRQSDGSLFDYLNQEYQKGQSNSNLKPTIVWKEN
jgi:hypothetical protein